MKNLNKTILGVAALTGFSSVATQAYSASKQEKMNILFMFVDDLGWADLGLRNPKFDTPNVDKFFNEGMNFERAYVGQPASSASRACLMTGMEPVRLQVVRHIENKDAGSGRKYNMWPNDPIAMPSLNYLPLEHTTYAERLHDFGYYNAFIGKWHLGDKPYWADKQGFDYCYGLSDYGNVSNYYAPFFRYKNGEHTMGDIPEGEFMTEVLTDDAVKFIKEYDRDQPFMMSLFYYDVHSPNIGRKDLVAKYKAEGMSAHEANYAAQVAVVDQSVGEVMKALEDKGIADNTVVIYFSDQGGIFPNLPLRGTKHILDTFAEGGIRVPLAIHYPGVTKPGSVCETPIQAIDFFPTLVEIASGKKCKDSQVNGVSLLPLLNGKEIKPRNLHFFRSYIDQYAAIINGDWKLIKYFSGKFQLYNIKNDIAETTDLQNQEPEIFEKMKKDLWAWEKEAVPTYENDYRNRLKSCLINE